MTKPISEASLPWLAEAQRLLVSRNGETLFDYRVEKSAPKLAARFPDGEHHSGVVEVSWSSSTPGVRVLLRYSADGGLSWIAMNLPDESRSCELDLNQLPGGERCCFELIASAGLRTRTVRSRFFRADPTTPRPLILSPGPDAARVSGPIELSGAITDRGDPGALVWTSSVDGELGQGPYLLFASLTPGGHRIGLHVGSPGELSEYTTIVVSGEQRERRNNRR